MASKRFDNLAPEKRTAILDAARLEFTGRGYEGSSLNAIIKAAGMSKGSFYYYFEDKLDLYITVVAYETERLFAEIGGFFSGEFSDDFWADVARQMHTAYDVFLGNHDYLRLIQGFFSLRPDFEHDERYVKLTTTMLDRTREIIAHGQELGEVRTDLPADLMAILVFKVGETMDYWIFEQHETLTPEKLTEKIHIGWDLYRRLLGSAPVKGGNCL